MFYEVYAFKGDWSPWDTSQVNEMTEMFTRAYAFNANVATWNTSRTTVMYGEFLNANSFNFHLSKWDTSKVTSFGNLFAYASSFNGDVSSWNTSLVTMFSAATSFNGDLSKWDTGQVSVMSWMFKGTTRFNGDLSRWNTSWVEWNASAFNKTRVGTLPILFVTGSVFNGSHGSFSTTSYPSFVSNKITARPTQKNHRPTRKFIDSWGGCLVVHLRSATRTNWQKKYIGTNTWGDGLEDDVWKEVIFCCIKVGWSRVRIHWIGQPMDVPWSGNCVSTQSRRPRKGHKPSTTGHRAALDAGDAFQDLF